MIHFMKYYWVYFVISGLVIILGLYSLLNYGLKLSIDFTGGTLLEFQLQDPNKFTQTDLEKQLTELNLFRNEISDGGKLEFKARLPQLFPSLGKDYNPFL